MEVCRNKMRLWSLMAAGRKSLLEHLGGMSVYLKMLLNIMQLRGGGQIFKKMFTFAILCFFTDSIQSIISPVRLLGFLAY